MEKKTLYMGTRMGTYMVTKNISITEEAYNLMKRHKRHGESFSEVIREHFKKKNSILDYAGIWADVPEKEWKEFEQRVVGARKGLSQSIKRKVGI